MIRLSARFLLTCTCVLAVSLLTAACETPSSQPMAQSGTPGPSITLQGESDQQEFQTIELDNCDGKAELERTERRSQTVSTAVSKEIAETLGVSAEVVSAEVQAAVSVVNTVGGEKSTEIKLKALAGTRMIFQLTWLGKEQLGIAENVKGWAIPIAFKNSSLLMCVSRANKISDAQVQVSQSKLLSLNPAPSLKASLKPLL